MALPFSCLAQTCACTGRTSRRTLPTRATWEPSQSLKGRPGARCVCLCASPNPTANGTCFARPPPAALLHVFRFQVVASRLAEWEEVEQSLERRNATDRKLAALLRDDLIPYVKSKLAKRTADRQVGGCGCM